MRKKQVDLQPERTGTARQARAGHFSETLAKWAGHSLPAPHLPPLNGISQNEDNCIGLQRKDPVYLFLPMPNLIPGDAVCQILEELHVPDACRGIHRDRDNMGCSVDPRTDTN